MVSSSAKHADADVVSDDQSADPTKIIMECELYNFGHAPFQVIQQFQDFCAQFTSLSEALNEILQRGPLLKRKYIFITAPVMYQMLARPTQVDSRPILEASIDALKKFTRRGRYDSVSHAIEELLFSPLLDTPISCDKETWTSGDVGTHYTELTRVEQDVLEKIADALLFRLTASTPEPKKRKSVQKPRKDFPPKKRRNELPVLSNVNQGSVAGASRKETVNNGAKFFSNHLCLNPVQQGKESVPLTDPVDLELLVPIKNFLNTRPKDLVRKLENSPTCYAETITQKGKFFERLLNLIPLET